MEIHPEIRATDTLANERTFLAYVRTALAFVAFGYVIARFSLFTREISIIAHMTVPGGASTIFGVGVATMGIAVGLYGSYRYVATDRGLHRATVVGTHTFGKGVFQEEEPLSNGGALDITVGEYFTPNGRNLGGGGIKQGAGVTPEVLIPHGVDSQHGLEVALSTLAAKVTAAKSK